MKLNELKEKIVGKELKTIFTIDIIGNAAEAFNKIVGHDYTSIDAIQVMLFGDSTYVAFVDLDCDGYRSGPWYVIDLENWLDTGCTKEVKNINSTVRDVIYMEEDSKEYLLITTDEYIIKMGQDSVDDYYPRNFFNVDELKQALIEGKLIKGKIVSLKED